MFWVVYMSNVWIFCQLNRGQFVVERMSAWREKYRKRQKQHRQRRNRKTVFVFFTKTKIFIYLCSAIKYNVFRNYALSIRSAQRFFHFFFDTLKIWWLKKRKDLFEFWIRDKKIQSLSFIFLRLLLNYCVANKWLEFLGKKMLPFHLHAAAIDRSNKMNLDTQERYMLICAVRFASGKDYLIFMYGFYSATIDIDIDCRSSKAMNAALIGSGFVIIVSIKWE